MQTIESLLTQVESLPSSDWSWPERLLRAACDMLEVDSVAAERALVRKVTDPESKRRINYVRTLMYLVGCSGRITDSTLDALIDLARSELDYVLANEATVAIGANSYENASLEAYEKAYRFVRDAAHHPPPWLTASTKRRIKKHLLRFEQHRGILADIARGRLLIRQEVLGTLLARTGQGSFRRLGYDEREPERLARHLAWHSRWLQHKVWLRKVGRDLFEIDASILVPVGLPHASITILWKRDKPGKRWILLDATLVCWEWAKAGDKTQASAPHSG